MNPAGREEHAVGIAGDRLRDLVVQGLPQGVEPPERALVSRQRPVAPAHAPPRVLDGDVEEHRERALAQRGPSLRVADGPSAEREHRRLRPFEQPSREGALALAESLFAELGEQLRNRAALVGLELHVDIDERALEQVRDPRAGARLAGAHEAGEG